MKILSVSEAKIKLSALVDMVASTDDEVTITKNGRPAAILVSPHEYESWKETIAIRTNQELMEEIKRGLVGLKKKKAQLYSLEEL